MEKKRRKLRETELLLRGVHSDNYLGPMCDKDGEIVGKTGVANDITERNRAEKMLESQHALLKALINSDRETIIFSLDRDYCYTVFNEKHREEMKRIWNADIKIGMNLLDCMRGPELRELAKQSIDRALKGEVFSEVQHQPGPDIYYEFSWNPIWQNKEVVGASAFIRDITGRRQLENDLRESRKLLQDVSDNSMSLIYIVNLEGQFLHVNKKLESLFGITRNYVIGKTRDSIMPGEIARKHRNNDLEVIRMLKPLEFEEQNIESDGEHIYYSIKFPLFNDKGDIYAVGGISNDITRHKSAEKALQKSEERNKKAQEAGHIGSWEFDIENKAFWGSDEGKRIYGFNLESDLFTPEEVMKCVIDRARVDQAMIDLIEKNKPYNIVFDINPLNSNEKRTINSIAELIRDEKGNPIKVIGVLIDITDSMRTKDALHISEENYRLLAEASPEMIYLIDQEGYIKYVNSIAAANLKLDVKKIIGKQLKEIFPPDIAHSHLTIIKKVFDTKEKIHSEIEEMFPTGKIWIDVRLSPVIDNNGNVVAVLGISNNITDRKRAEEEVQRKNKELHLLNSEKDKFFSIIAHDLRSPFNAFLGFTRLMVEDLPSLRLNEIQKIALTMRKSATNLYNLLENLLEWSRLQRNVTTFTPATFSLMKTLSDNMLLALESAKNKEIEISYKIPEGLVVFADENMLGCIIRNLSSNAVKFTPKGGKVTIEAKPVDDGPVEISIKDTGIGLNKELLGNLFQLDINTNRKGTENEPSTGLGLIICKEFVEKHGGKIWVESEEGKGSTFCFTLPHEGKKSAKQV